MAIPCMVVGGRGTECGFGRFVTVSGGGFAVAITLLVLTMEPDGVRGEDLVRDLDARLIDLLPQIEAYFLAFAIVGRFWIGHHRFFGELCGFDRGLMALNLVYLSLIVFLPVPVEVLGEHGEQEAAVVFFAMSMAAAGLVEALMAFYAQRRELVLPELRAYQPRVIAMILTTPAVFLISIPVAWVAPGVAPWLWIALFPLMALEGRRSSRLRRHPSSA